MRFITYRRQGREAPGLALDDGRIADLSQVAPDMLGLIEAGAEGLAAARAIAETPGETYPDEDVEVLAPIPRPRKNVFCVGRNYLDHIAEGAKARGEALPKLNGDLPKYPTFFTKAPTAVNCSGGAVRLDPRVTAMLDYEAELGVVIGKAGRDIALEDAFDHVFGYTVINDITARDLQKRHGQFFKGKTLDGSCPMGPWIVDAETFGDPATAEIRLSVNGEVRQSAGCSQMIFDVPAIIASLSEGMTLEPGDVIATGTPAGVGFAMDPPCFLRGGDIVVAYIDRIGDLVSIIEDV